MVVPRKAASLRASATTSRSAATPSIVVLSCSKRAPTASASRRPIVVLPEPGGPHRIIEGRRPPSTSRRSGAFGPRRCAWPTTSSSVRGRMRAARGASSGGGVKSGSGARPAGRRAGTGPWYAGRGPADRRRARAPGPGAIGAPPRRAIEAAMTSRLARRPSRQSSRPSPGSPRTGPPPSTRSGPRSQAGTRADARPARGRLPALGPTTARSRAAARRAARAERGRRAGAGRTSPPGGRRAARRPPRAARPRAAAGARLRPR